MMNRTTAAAAALLTLCSVVWGEMLEQIISRENVHFQVRTASLTVGRDGHVYLCSGGNDSFVLRMTADGKDKFGSSIVYAASNATANAEGVVASANGHFAHKVTLYDKRLGRSAAVADFLVNDTVGWDAPAHVEAGGSGDFYGLDQHRDRVLRITPDGKVRTTYAVPHAPAGSAGRAMDFRVCEKTSSLYVLTQAGSIRCVGFDGKVRWAQNARLAGAWYLGCRAFDVADDGTLYLLPDRQDAVLRVSATGDDLEPIALQIGRDRPGPADTWFHALRICGDNLLIRRASETELFQRYDLQSGERRQVVVSEHERLAVSLPRLVWTAGESLPFDIRFDAPGQVIRPRWRVWARPFGSVDYRELPVENGQLRVPADCSGLYVVKVTPEVQPWQRGETSEYQVRAFIEVRQPDARGSATVLTPAGRVHFGRGEAIPVSLIVRGPDKRPVAATVRVTDGDRVLARSKVVAEPGGEAARLTLPGSLTAGLLPGDYRLEVSADGMTCSAQRLRIGPGLAPAPFHRVQYGDYREMYPSATPWDAPDVVAAHATRVRRLGMDLMVDRLGSPLQTGRVEWDNPSRGTLRDLEQRLEADPQAVAPARVRAASPLLQTMAAYGAQGIRQMAILMDNDAGLPLGTGFDKRPAEQILEALARVTKAMAPYPAFRGWTWSSNWWVFGERGAKAARTPEDRAACEAALKRANETGAWDPVLDKVAALRLGHAVEAQELFNKSLRALAPGLVTAVAAPYRNVESYPPVTFRNVDEVDLHIQWEQIAVPYHAPHNVDFYKRPGKPGWGHPEVWNDDGTGGQVLSVLFQMIMRGADGVGCSGIVPPWTRSNDPRLAHLGTVSVFRALNGFLRQYGPWLTTLEGDDRVALVASGRMFRIDTWCSAPMGRHFARLLEAYIACLHAHRPASIVFAEDVNRDSLKPFKAVLVVGQRVELEPGLAEALQAAKAAGTSIFFDGTCREELVRGFTPLKTSFNQVENDPSAAGDDAAYWRFDQYTKAHLPALLEALGPVVPPVAEVANDEILLSQRKAGKGRYVFVVNNTIPRLEPGHLWRVNLCLTARVPARVPLRLAPGNDAIYEVLAMEPVAPQSGVVQADLRSHPARIFARLPAAIAQVELRGPEVAGAGLPFAWRVRVLDATGKPIEASVPVRVRLLDSGGAPVHERFAAAQAEGAGGTFTAPLNGRQGGLVLEAVELFSGRSARLPVAPAVRSLPVSIPSQDAPQGAPPAAATARIAGAARAAGLAPTEEAFGPHICDMVIADDARLVVANTMNWDHNLYAIDVATGETRWRQRVGQYFAFAPQTLQDGVAAQGFDFQSAEGYHLYLVGQDGSLRRRFALYGLPRRLPHRFVPGLTKDRINNFAVPASGRWVASAGDLGLAVWDGDGKLLWSQDWWKTERREAHLAAADEGTLLVAEGLSIAAYDARAGQRLWQQSLAPTGEVTKMVAARGVKTLALLTTAEGGRVFLLRDGKPARALATGGSDLALSADGALAAVASDNQLKLYSVAEGLQWTFAGDSDLRTPRFSPEGGRIVTSSDDGSVYVLDLDGGLLLERDLGARPVPQWLPGGDLVLGTWMGTVCRLDRQYREVWRIRLTPEAPDMTGRLLAEDGAPTTRIATWSNAEPKTAPLTPNVLAETPVRITLVPSGSWGGTARLAHDTAPLHDGKTTPPDTPWIGWNYVGFFAETSPVNFLQIDTFNRQVRVEAISLWEDPAHPESWLRDASFEYWHAGREQWRPAMPILADAAAHTHRLAQPVEAARFRILLPYGVVGNLRLSEIVFHGEVVGCSHPDVVAKRPVAVLFDEQDEVGKSLQHFGRQVSYQFDGAFSGGRCLKLNADQSVGAAYLPPFGHRVPHWDFEIAENPAPGQYRYLRFAWRALAPGTTGITLRLGPSHWGGVAVSAGEPTDFEGSTPTVAGDAPPTEWTVVELDLWAQLQKPLRIGGLSLACHGGAAAFDQILLGRTKADLAAYRAPER